MKYFFSWNDLFSLFLLSFLLVLFFSLFFFSLRIVTGGMLPNTTAPTRGGLGLTIRSEPNKKRTHARRMRCAYLYILFYYNYIIFYS